MFNTRLTLLEKLKSKYNENAWSEFYDNYNSYIGAVIANFRVPASDIDDLIQKVMLVSWEKIPEFEYNKDKGLFRSWLIRIAKNVVLNHFAKQNRSANKMSAFSESQKLNDMDAVLAETAEKEWRIHISKMAWESIRNNYQENAQKVFDLVIKGCPNKEIAETLNLSQNAVAVFKKRITEALRDEILRLDDFLS